MQSDFHFTITGELSNNWYLTVFKLTIVITDIQTATFPLPSRVFPKIRTQRFFVYVDDGRITKNTEDALLDGQSLHWSEELDGLWGDYFIQIPNNYLTPFFTSAVDSSSRVTIKVVEKHSFKDDHFATFVIPYDILRSSQNGLLLLFSWISPNWLRLSRGSKHR